MSNVDEVIENVKRLKKMTLKTIHEMGRTDDAKAHFASLAKNETLVASIVGEMTAWGSKSSQYGPSHYITGDFFARNEVTGVLYSSSVLYLPKATAEILIAAFDKRGNPEEKIKVNLSVRVVEDKSSATGYTYVVEPIETPESTSQKKELLSKLLAAPTAKMLAGPSGQKQLTSGEASAKKKTA